MTHDTLNRAQLVSEANAAAQEAVEAVEPAEMSGSSTLNGMEKTMANLKPEQEEVREHRVNGGTKTVEGGENEGRAAGLHDQTNLLPMRQLLVVFAGLSSAMFCK